MKFDISIISVDLGNEFVETLNSWKEKITREGIRNRLRKLIEKDLKQLEDKK